MAKRTTKSVANVEYKDDTNKLRTSELVVNVEYNDDPNMIRTTKVAVMVEYGALPALPNPLVMMSWQWI